SRRRHAGDVYPDEEDLLTAGPRRDGIGRAAEPAPRTEAWFRVLYCSEGRGPGALLVRRRRRRARNRLAEHLDRAEVDVAAGAMAAAGHQVREADLVNLRQVGVRHPDLVVRVRRPPAAAAVDGDDAHRV